MTPNFPKYPRLVKCEATHLHLSLTGLSTLEGYEYLGLSTVARRSRPEAGIDLTTIKLTSESNGDAGDKYTGLERFGRIADQRWIDTLTGEDLDRYGYTHDRNGNRLSRENRIDQALSELYAYDDLDRLTNMDRGTQDASIVGSHIYHKNSSFDINQGVEAALDNVKSPVRESAEGFALSYDHLINTSRGINGLVFDVENLALTSLAASDFVFQVSPQNTFNESTHPPVSWSSAPAPSAITVQAASGGNPARIIIAWADNAIEDRWLRVTLKANANTGLFNAETFYVGHLRGETTGPNGSGLYTVSSADKSAIQAAVGQNVGIGSILDINKDGQITFTDISAMNSNIGDQMANITTTANPLADLTRSQSWSLDALGNWNGLSNNGGPSEARGHNLQNQIASIGSTTLTYDAGGNLTTDDQGRLLVWNAWNQLVRVEYDSTVLVEYQYDALKRRIVEDNGTTERHLYYSNQWQVLEERINGNAVAQNVWSPVYVDAMILRDRDADANTGNGLEERLYVLHDANFNVTALADTDGEIVERYYYEAYGKATILDSDFVPRPDAQSDYAWQYLHQGGRLDIITGNYHFRNRDLSPELGRWLNQDPIGFEGGDWNLYGYLGAKPINLLDPSGTWTPPSWPITTVTEDKQGQEILKHWLEGSGKPVIHYEGEWGKYMRANELLKPQIANELIKDASSRSTSGAIDIQFQPEIENGYRSGYEMLHGPNASVGGFKIQGEAYLSTDKNGNKVVAYDTLFIWNDIIDPNPEYLGDRVYPKVVTSVGFNPADYDIHIGWTDRSTITLDSNGNPISSFGYPFNSSPGQGGGGGRRGGGGR